MNLLNSSALTVAVRLHDLCVHRELRALGLWKAVVFEMHVEVREVNHLVLVDDRVDLHGPRVPLASPMGKQPAAGRGVADAEPPLDGDHGQVHLRRRRHRRPVALLVELELGGRHREHDLYVDHLGDDAAVSCRGRGSGMRARVE